jgi:hypothetical protein
LTVSIGYYTLRTMLKNPKFLPVLFLSLIALSACTQVSPPKAAQNLAKAEDEKKEEEALAEASYTQLEIKRDLEGSQSFLIEAGLKPEDAGTMKVTIYNSCDTSKKIETTLEQAKNKDLYEAVSALLSGKIKVEGQASDASEEEKATESTGFNAATSVAAPAAATATDATELVSEEMKRVSLILTDSTGDIQKVFVAPKITDEPNLLVDLDAFISEKVKGHESALIAEAGSGPSANANENKTTTGTADKGAEKPTNTGASESTEARASTSPVASALN